MGCLPPKRDAYFYRKNFFGDVTAIYNESGECVAQYAYNAWGEHKILENTNGIATLNPIRYRGYYYDTHTGLYYLQSRYYNPEWGRFISADCYISTGQGLLGNNMYIYCNNNPVMYVDPEGRSWESFWNGVEEKVIKPVGKFLKKTGQVLANIGEDLWNLRFNNDSEQVVLDSNYFSFYKGTLVIRMGGSASEDAFSYGIIFLGNKITDPDVVKHEYGHKLQFDKLGIVDYTTQIMIPSVTAYMLDKQGKLPEGAGYYGSPWEAEADRLGGVNRTENNEPWAPNSYWDLVRMFWNRFFER